MATDEPRRWRELGQSVEVEQLKTGTPVDLDLQQRLDQHRDLTVQAGAGVEYPLRLLQQCADPALSTELL